MAVVGKLVRHQHMALQNSAINSSLDEPAAGKLLFQDGKCQAASGTRFAQISCNEADMEEIPRPLVDRFIDSLCYAA